MTGRGAEEPPGSTSLTERRRDGGMEGTAEEPPNKDGKARRQGRRRERERGDRSEIKKKAPCSLTSPLARLLTRSPAPSLSPASPGFYYPFSKTNVGSPRVTWDHLPYRRARAGVSRRQEQEADLAAKQEADLATEEPI